MRGRVLLVGLIIFIGVLTIPYANVSAYVESEPNDTSESANTISHVAKSNETKTYTGTLNNTDTTDWYGITNLVAHYIGGTDTIEVLLNHTGAGTITITLIDPNGMKLMSAVSTPTTTARVATVVHTTGKYNVLLQGDGSSVEYTMKVNITAYCDYTSDGNDQIDYASMLSSGNSATDTIDNYTDPQDFYLISTQSMGYNVDVVTISILVPQTSSMILERYLWNETTGKYDFEDSIDDGALIDGKIIMRFRAKTAPLTQYYYFRVFAKLGFGSYTITANIETYNLDNDGNPSLAKEVVQRKKSYIDEIRQEFDIDVSDYYKVYMNVSERLTVELFTFEFNETTCMPKFELHLYDVNVQEIADTCGYDVEYEKLAWDVSVEGYYYVEVRAVEGAGAYRINFTINYPPVITDYQPTALSLSLNEGVETRFNITVFDGDNDPLWYSWHINGAQIPGAVYKMFLFKGNISGDINLTVYVSDGKDYTCMSWNLDVNGKPQLLDYMPTNDSTITVYEMETITFTVSASDPDLPLTYTWILDNTVLQESSSNSFTFAPNYTAVTDVGGVRTLKVSISDTLGAYSEVSWRINIINVNQIPYLVAPLPEVIVTEDTRLDNALDLKQYFADNDTEDADNLYFSYSGNTNLAIEIRNGVVAVTPTVANWTGSEIVTFTVNDTKNSFSAQATFTVVGVNDAPVVRQNAPSVVYLLQDTVNSSLNLAEDVFYDCDTTLLTFSAFGNLSIFVSIAQDGKVSLSAQPYWRGNETITFSCSDGTFTAYKDIKVIIIPVNHAPKAEIISPKEGAKFKARMDVNFSGLGTDPDGDTLIYIWKEGTDTIGNTESFKRAFLEGNYEITLIVDDGHGGTDRVSVNITVEKKSTSGSSGSGTPGVPTWGILFAISIASVIVMLRKRGSR